MDHPAPHRLTGRWWILPMAWATIGLLFLWSYAARPVSRTDDAAAAQPSSTRVSQATSGPAVTGPSTSSPAPSGTMTTSPVSEPVVFPTVPAAAAVGPPTRLRLVNRAIAAPVTVTGLSDDGSLQIPTNPGVIGWYSSSARPGATKGAMVMAGHINSLSYGNGVLSALAKTRVGDMVVVQVGDGRGFPYRVTRIDQFHKRELPLSSIFTSTGSPKLVMLTCSGRFLGRGLGYEDNLVVTAAPAG